MRLQLMEDWALTELFQERYRMEIADGDQVRGGRGGVYAGCGRGCQGGSVRLTGPSGRP